MKAFIISTLLATIIIFPGCLTSNSDNQIWSKYKLETPENIILKNFDTHDIIFLGEPHHIKQHLQFLQKTLNLLGLSEFIEI